MAEPKTVSFAKNQVIFREGAPADCLYEITRPADGKVGIYKNYGTDSQKLLTTLTVGQCFGEIALVNNSPRTASAVALTEVELTVVDESTFDAYYEKEPAKLEALLQNGIDRLRSLTADYLAACNALADYQEEIERDGKASARTTEALKKYMK